MIYLLEGEAGLKSRLATLFAEAGNIVTCTSGIARLECLVGPLKKSDSALTRLYERFFYATVSLPVCDNACERAAQIRAEHGLLIPDALHLAIAEVNRCNEFWTADAHFRPVSSLKNIEVRILA